MSDKKKTTEKASPPTVITLTLPEEGKMERQATLLIQRGDLAHLRQFPYSAPVDIPAVIQEAMAALAEVEANPPVIPDPPKEAPKPMPSAKSGAKTVQQRAAPQETEDEEPTLEIPLKKGKLAVKISFLKIIGGETDAAAYQQAVQIAGRLVDGKLWDGQTPIRIDDVYAVQRKLKHLTDKDLSLFTLSDFVQMGAAAGASQNVPDNPDETPDGEAAADKAIGLASVTAS